MLQQKDAVQIFSFVYGFASESDRPEQDDQALLHEPVLRKVVGSFALYRGYGLSPDL